jgi:single-stranded-DNA-specific exonuclease
MAGEERYFLDIRQSACGLAWRHRLDQRQENIALAMAQTHGVPDIVARILAGRGVTLDAAGAFPRSDHPRSLARSVLADRHGPGGRTAGGGGARREPVAIFGDYDVDGAASAALLKRYFNHFGMMAEIYIPDRIFEGYGPNPQAMRELVARGASLIVTVDCGTNSHAAIEAANAAGAEVVVLDHHQVAGDLPPAVAIVNPNREDDLSGQGHLCAAGVVFLALVRTARLLREAGHDAGPDLMSLLDLVALATVCDVVPLVGVNRAFVVKGLQVARGCRIRADALAGPRASASRSTPSISAS